MKLAGLFEPARACRSKPVLQITLANNDICLIGRCLAQHGHSLRCLGSRGAAQLLSAQGDLTAARRPQEQVLEAMTGVLSQEHVETLTSMNSLALTLGAQCDHDGARRLQERVLEMMTHGLGENHPDTLTSMNNLAWTLSAQGDLRGARRLQQHALEALTRLLGSDDPDPLKSMYNLAATLEAQGDHDGALRLLRKCLAGRRKVLGEDHLRRSPRPKPSRACRRGHQPYHPHRKLRPHP